MTNNKHLPHRAAFNHGPWQSFPDYESAKAWVDRRVKKPTDKAWIRCVADLTPNERVS